MLSDFKTKILNFLNAQKPFEHAARVLAAVSGGADSVALLSILQKLNQAENLGLHLTVAHVNHSLRGRSADEDEDFVVQMAQKMNLKCLTRTVDTKAFSETQKISIETAARKLRIDALTEMAAEAECRYVATAHHADDNTETIIHRLLRGTAFRGLAGIRPVRKFDSSDITFVRPMLAVTRPEIIDYCTAKNISWRHDHTNDEFAFTRNRIRHLLLPHLRQNSNLPLTELLNSLAESSRRLYKKVEFQTQKLQPSVILQADDEKVVLDKLTFSKLHPLIQAEFINTALTLIGAGLKKITEDHYLAVASLAAEPIDKQILLPGRISVIANNDTITFTKSQKKQSSQLLPSKPLTLSIGKTASFGPWTIETEVLDVGDCDIEKFKNTKDNFIEWFDYDKLILPLSVRPRQNGDSFHPLGAPAPKKIGKFLTAEKIAPELKAALAVFTDKEKIIWTAPVRPSELTKITKNTNKILQIKIQKKTNGLQ